MILASLEMDLTETQQYSQSTSLSMVEHAVYVDDDSNSGTSCASDIDTECFFQVLAIHGQTKEDIYTQSIHFSHNHAIISGSTLYGGLLDRCIVSMFSEVHYNHPTFGLSYEGNGITYFNDVSNSSYYSYELNMQRKRKKKKNSSQYHLIQSKCVYVSIRPLSVVNVFLLTSELTKACGRAVIIIHYFIILPQST